MDMDKILAREQNILLLVLYTLVNCSFWFTRDDPITEFSLRQFSKSKDVKPAIDKIVQKGGLSNVGE